MEAKVTKTAKLVNFIRESGKIGRSYGECQRQLQDERIM